MASILDDAAHPTVGADPDTVPVQLGIRFDVLTAGTITGIKIFHTGASAQFNPQSVTLWTAGGSALAKASVPASSTRGWQTIKLASPVAVAARTTYVASYQVSAGRYPSSENFFTSPEKSADFMVQPDAGVYSYSGGFPTQTWNHSNYWVDVDLNTGSKGTTSAPVTTSANPPSTSTSRSTTTTTPRSTPTTTTTTTTRSTTTTPPATGGTIVLGRSFPSASTTGVPSGTALSNYTGPCSIQTNNVVIDAKTINCDLRILAQNVVITRSVINGTIYSDPDYFNGSFTLTDSEVRMPPTTGTGIGDVNFVVTRVEVTGGSRSINCAANCTVQDSYLHGQYTDLRGIDHESGVRMGANSVIKHNYITCDAKPIPPDSGCSAAITGYGDFAIVQKNTIDNNLIDGGPAGSMGYCTYGGSTTGKPFSAGVNNIKYTNNIFRRGPSGICGIWGPITSFDSKAPGNVWSNNLWDDGKVVPAAN